MKLKIIAPVNNKGGVGKSTVCRLLLEYFALVLGHRTLAVDLDAQCNLSRRFVKMEIDPVDTQGVLPPIHSDYDPSNLEDIHWDGRSSIADIFYGEPVLPYPTHIPSLEITPGHSTKLLAAEAVRKSEISEKVHLQLKTFLELPEVKEAYDVIVIDTPPSKGPLTISVIKAATHILIPSVLEPQPIEGVFGMLQLWKQEQIQRFPHNPLNLIGILPNMFRNVRLHQDLLADLKRNRAICDYILPLSLGQRTIFSEMDAEGASHQSIFELPDHNKAKLEALAACEYIARRIFNDEEA
jgi:chromosome partitioning protein